MKFEKIDAYVGRTRNKRTALALSTALVSITATGAFAQTVDISTAVSNASVNSAIADEAAEPNANINLNLSAAAVVTGGPINIVSTAVGQADGALAVTNAGKIGTVNAEGDVTATAGLVLTGAGQGVAANNALVNNTGLVTGGVFLNSLGGNAAITNNGIVHGGLTASAYGDVAITTGAAGLVRSDSAIFANSLTQADTTSANGVDTTTVTGGDASITQNGDALSADGTGRANLSAMAGAGNVDVCPSSEHLAQLAA